MTCRVHWTLESGGFVFGIACVTVEFLFLPYSLLLERVAVRLKHTRGETRTRRGREPYYTVPNSERIERRRGGSERMYVSFFLLSFCICFTFLHVIENGVLQYISYKMYNCILPFWVAVKFLANHLQAFRLCSYKQNKVL